MSKEKKPKKTGKKTDIIENVGKVMINLGQLMFGTLFLGTVLRGEMPHYIIMIAGITGAVLFIKSALPLPQKNEKPRRNSVCL